jgi:cell wall-associated NlpC family hydrolase
MSEVIKAARSWLGTPFAHQGRVKGVGGDCLGLLIGVAAELELRDKEGRLLAEYDALDYGHLPDEKRLWRGLKKHLFHWERSESTQCDTGEGLVTLFLNPPPKSEISTLPLGRGNIGLFRIDGTARHLGIIAQDTGYPTLIHAYAPARKVVEHRFDQIWQERLVALFSIPSQNR